MSEQNTAVRSLIFGKRKSKAGRITVNELNTSPTKHVPIETRVFYGVTYSIGITDGGFKVLICDREDATEDIVQCFDVPLDDPKELLVLAHAHAQKSILEKLNGDSGNNDS